jgi:hypothetical protein
VSDIPARVIRSAGGAGVIAAFASDLRGAANTSIFSRVSGTAPNRSLAIQWQNINVAVPTGPSPAVFTTEMVLAENGTIRINFGSSTVQNNADIFAQIGLRGTTETDFQGRTTYTSNRLPSGCWGGSYQRSFFPTNLSVLFTPFPPPASPTTFSISGRCLGANNVGLANASILINNVSRAVTDAQGNYSVSGLANGTYAVQPQLQGMVFSPQQTSVTIAGANNLTTNFSALGGSITSTVRLASGGNLNGVAFNIQTPTNTIIRTQARTNVNSTTASNLVNGTYTVTPVLAGYTFTPLSRSVTISGGALQTVEFQANTVVATSQSITIIGTVSQAYSFLIAGMNIMQSKSLPNFQLNLLAFDARTPNNRPIVATTFSDAQGLFTFSNVPTTAQSAFLIQAASIPNADAIAYRGNPAGYPVTSNSVILGSIGDGGTKGVPNIRVQLNTGQVTTTDNFGNFQFFNLPPGSYTVTPNIGNVNYTFSPSTTVATVAPGRAQLLRFTATVPQAMQSGFSAPLLLTPANGAEVIAGNNNSFGGMSWASVPEAIDYFIQFSDSPNFLKTGSHQTGGQNIVNGLSFGNYFTPTANGTTMYWRVKAIKGNEESQWSEVRTFLFKIPAPLPTLPSIINVQSGFDPRVHGFSFANWSGSQTDESPFVWTRQYYGGVNYNTGDFIRFKQQSSSFKIASELMFPSRNPSIPVSEPTRLWDDFARSYSRFAPATVRNSGVTTVVTAAADGWLGEVDKNAEGKYTTWGGSCRGFAIASVLNYSGVYSRAVPSKLQTTNDIRRLIHTHQSNQSVLGLNNGSDSPTVTLQKLIAAFNTRDPRKHPTLSIRDAGGGHALVPYRISTGIVNGRTLDSVFVYDMNKPQPDSIMRQAIIVDRANNSWRYYLGRDFERNRDIIWSGNGRNFTISSDAGTEGIRPVNFEGRPITHAEDDEIADIPTTVTFTAAASGGEQPQVVVKNEFGTMTNGKDPFGDDNQFVGASPIQLLTGEINSPLPAVSGYKIPSNLARNLDIDYKPIAANSANSLSYSSGDRLFTNVTWTAADTRGQGLSVDAVNDITRFTTNSIIPEATFTHAKLDETKAEWENVVRVTMRGLVAGDSLTTTLINDGKQVALASNAGPGSPTKTYSISFTRGVGQTFERLSLNPNHLHTFVIENWDNIAQSGVVQLIDTNRDFSADEIRTLRVATNVRAASNDGTFAVSVFPNPASSTLTMQFTLAQAAEVRAELTNILGVPVKLLFVGERTGGIHSFSAETDGIPSGTYFLRIRAGNATVVKPVQIIK